ncbi:MAG TPA: hypothetical protein VNF04_02740 [Stellaceae bacterium]|nr:hypothetical protein [Stellaceae bacterium]
MGIRDSYRKTMLGLTGPDSVAALNGMETYFSGGAKWTQGAYHRGDGTKCLVGAADHVQRAAGIKLADPKYWIRRAIAERQGVVSPVLGIESFNDSRTSYDEIAQVLTRAKQLALEHKAQQTPARPALTYHPEEDRVVSVTLTDMERVAVKRGGQ